MRTSASVEGTRHLFLSHLILAIVRFHALARDSFTSREHGSATLRRARRYTSQIGQLAEIRCCSHLLTLGVLSGWPRACFLAIRHVVAIILTNIACGLVRVRCHDMLAIRIISATERGRLFILTRHDGVPIVFGGAACCRWHLGQHALRNESPITLADHSGQLLCLIGVPHETYVVCGHS